MPLQMCKSRLQIHQLRYSYCMGTSVMDLSLQENQLKVSHLGAGRYGVPVLSVSGGLGPEGWPLIREACRQMCGRTRLLDFSGVTHVQTSLDDAAAFGRQLARQSVFNPRLPCHLLIAPGDLLFGLCRVIEMNLDTAGLKAVVFRSVGAALKWLGEENRLPNPPDH
jgi:hypothetical protein